MIKNYTNARIWEFVLCVIMATGLLMNFSMGFYIPDALADNVFFSLLITAAVLAVCFAGGYNKIMTAAAVGLFAVLAVIIFIIMRVRGIDIVDTQYSDTSAYIYLFAAIIIPIIVYLLSRTSVGTGVLLIAGSCLGAVIDFLGYDTKMWCAGMFVFACIIMLAVRCYGKSIVTSSTVKPQFGFFTLCSAACVAIGFVIAILVFLLVIKPLEPPTVDIELFTHYLSYETLQKIGVADDYPIPDEMLEAQKPDTGTVESNNAEEDDPQQDEQQAIEYDRQFQDNLSGGASGDEQSANAVSYGVKPLPVAVIAAVVIIAAVVSLWLLKKTSRKRFVEKAKQLTASERIVLLYGYYLERFKKLGLGRQSSQTELEYAAVSGQNIGNMVNDEEVFENMTDVFVRVRYGGVQPTQQEDELLTDFYDKFLQCYRQNAGTVKYILNYFKL